MTRLLTCVLLLVTVAVSAQAPPSRLKEAQDIEAKALARVKSTPEYELYEAAMRHRMAIEADLKAAQKPAESK